MQDISLLKTTKDKRDHYTKTITDRKVSAKVDVERKQFEINFESHKISLK